MSDAKDPASLREYIEQNRTLYTRAAITETLLKAGFSSAEIEAVWQDLIKEDAARLGVPAYDPEPPLPNKGGIAVVLPLWFVFLLVSGFLQLLTTIAFTFSNSGDPEVHPLVNVLFFVANGGILAVCLYLLLSQKWPTPRVLGVMVGLFFAWWVIISGMCLTGVGRV